MNRIYRIEEKYYENPGIPFTRGRQSSSRRDIKRISPILYVWGWLTQLLDECEAAGVKNECDHCWTFSIKGSSFTLQDAMK